MKRDNASVYMQMRRDTPLPLYAPVHILDNPPLFPELCTYLMNDLFLNQKTNNIQISNSLKYKHSKKILYEKINVIVRRGVPSPTGKNTAPPKDPIPT